MKVGRWLTADIASTLGTGVNGFIRRLGYSFNDAGLPFQQTSYYNTAGNNVANQVQDTYNGYGQLTAEYQNNAGAVNVSTTPAVVYGYARPAGANYSRLTTLTYPGGRVLDYGYDPGIDITISRLSGMSGPGGTNIESYSYLGLDTIIRKIRPGSVLTLVKAYGTSNGDAGDIYTGLDRFGRVADQKWVTSDTPNGTSGDTLGTLTDRFQYGFDQDSNVLYRANGVNSAFSELYHANGAGEATAYDPLNRLTGFSRGALSASGNNGTTLDTITSPSAADSWTLDALGNSINEGGIARTFNGKNQIATYGGTSTITYDHDGNMTTDQAGNTYHFDAWNRMVAVYVAGSPFYYPSEFYTYDALGRRPGLTITNGGVTSSYYSANWQDLEDDVTQGVAHNVTTYVWSASYIDDVVARDHSVNGGSATRVFAQQDANHDVTGVLNPGGTVQERFAYSPYGARLVLTAGWAAASDTQSWLVGLQGGRYDPLTGLVNFRNRDLNTGLDVWMEQDPAGYWDGANVYAFVHDNPTDYVDPSGLGGMGPGSGFYFGMPPVHSGPVTPDQLPPPPAVPIPPPLDLGPQVSGPLVYLYTGNWTSTQVVYDAATSGSGKYLYCKSPLRGALVTGAVQSNKNPEQGKGNGGVGGNVWGGWTMDEGWFWGVEGGPNLSVGAGSGGQVLIGKGWQFGSPGSPYEFAGGSYGPVYWQFGKAGYLEIGVGKNLAKGRLNGSAGLLFDYNKFLHPWWDIRGCGCDQSGPTKKGGDRY